MRWDDMIWYMMIYSHRLVSWSVGASCRSQSRWTSWAQTFPRIAWHPICARFRWADCWQSDWVCHCHGQVTSTAKGRSSMCSRRYEALVQQPCACPLKRLPAQSTSHSWVPSWPCGWTWASLGTCRRTRMSVIYDDIVMNAYDINWYQMISNEMQSHQHQLQNHHISYHIISYHIISYHIISYQMKRYQSMPTPS